MPAMETARRSNGLQVLRALAALLVVVHHSTQIVSFHPGSVMGPYSAGANGVDIFFVLSGVVIYISSLKLMQAPSGWKTFTVRRALRIVPMYWVLSFGMLLAIGFLPGLFQRRHASLLWAMCSLLFLPAHATDGAIAPVLVVGWTLNFEVFFYLLFGLALFFRRNPFVVVGVSLAALSVASLLPLEFSQAWTFYLNPIMLEFFAGMVLAGFYVRERRLPAWLAIASSALGLWWLTTHFYNGLWSRPMSAGVAATLLVLSALSLDGLLRKVPAWILFLADATYVLYLSHTPVLLVFDRVVLRHVRLPESVSVAVLVGAAVAVGSGLHALVEKPLQRWVGAQLQRRVTRPVEMAGAGVEGFVAAGASLRCG